MHAYRTHTCGELRRNDAGAPARLSGWVHRKRDHGQLLFIDLRDHYGLTQCVIDSREPALQGRWTRLKLESVVTVTGTGGERSPETVNPKLADRRDRGADRRARGPVRGRAAAVPGQRRGRLSRGDAAQIPLPRSAARDRARQHHAALAGHRLDPPAHDRAGLHRVPDADPDRVLARGRARLSGAEPAPSRQVLRAAAGAAAVQAAADGGGLRPLFPDRALLPRRGEPRRPLARASSTSSISRCAS